MRNPESDRERAAEEKRAINRYVPDADYHENRYANALDSAVAPGALWLDLGAGTKVHGGWLGTSAEALSRRAQMLIGTDLVGPHLRRNRYLSGAVLAEAGWLPFRDGAFDLVSANMVVEHLEYPVKVFTEVARLLKRGGVFIFSTPNRNYPIVRASASILSLHDHGAPFPRPWSDEILRISFLPGIGVIHLGKLRRSPKSRAFASVI